jgi:DNA-binding MarR family transcriptional regulator
MQPDLSDLAELFLRVVPQVTRVIAADIRRSGLDIEPGYIHLLRILSRSDRSLGDLAEVFTVSAPTMSKTVSTLEGRGWVQRRRSEADGRVVLVSLTPDGGDLLARAEDYMLTRIEEALSSLDGGDREALYTGLGILRDAFVNAPAGDDAPVGAG